MDTCHLDPGAEWPPKEEKTSFYVKCSLWRAGGFCGVWKFFVEVKEEIIWNIMKYWQIRILQKAWIRIRIQWIWNRNIEKSQATCIWITGIFYCGSGFSKKHPGPNQGIWTRYTEKNLYLKKSYNTGAAPAAGGGLQLQDHQKRQKWTERGF